MKIKIGGADGIYLKGLILTLFVLFMLLIKKEKYIYNKLKNKKNNVLRWF